MTLRFRTWLPLAGVFIALSQPVYAGDASPPKGILPIPDYSGDLLHRAYLTGDWDGARTNLANKGVQFEVDYTQYLQGVTSGGLDTTTEYGGHLDYLLHIDLMRMGLIPGAFVTVRAETRYGNSVNARSGQILPANTIAEFPLTDGLDDNVPIAVTDLNYTQFLAPTLAVTLGKIDTLDADLNEFSSGRGTQQFMNANFLFNSVTALRLPYSTLGVAVTWLPTPLTTVKGAVINTADSSTTSGFESFGSGTTATLEGDFQYRLGELPGGFNVGGLYSFDQRFVGVNSKLIFQPGEGLTIRHHRDTWSIYASGWQYLYVADPSDAPINTSDGRPDHQGIGLFGRAGLADDETNPVSFSLSGGIGGRGLIPSRENDQYGVGYFYTRFQNTNLGALIGAADKSQGFEAFYNIALTPAMQWSFDAQVLDSALPGVSTAVVLGTRLNLRF